MLKTFKNNNNNKSIQNIINDETLLEKFTTELNSKNYNQSIEAVKAHLNSLEKNRD